VWQYVDASTIYHRVPRLGAPRPPPEAAAAADHAAPSAAASKAPGGRKKELVSLAKLVAYATGRPLDKRQQISDWCESMTNITLLPLKDLPLTHPRERSAHYLPAAPGVGGGLCGSSASLSESAAPAGSRPLPPQRSGRCLRLRWSTRRWTHGRCSPSRRCWSGASRSATSEMVSRCSSSSRASRGGQQVHGASIEPPPAATDDRLCSCIMHSQPSGSMHRARPQPDSGRPRMPQAVVCAMGRQSGPSQWCRHVTGICLQAGCYQVVPSCLEHAIRMLCYTTGALWMSAVLCATYY
jgi:hypothetical protein